MAEQKKCRYKRLMKNIFLLFTGNFVSRILSFLMVPFYTSILTTSDYGTSDLISTTVLLVLPIFSLLMDESVMRFTLEPKYDRKQVFSIAFDVSLLGFIVVMCISPMILLFESLKPYYWFIVLYYIFSWIYNVIVSYVKGLDKLSIITAAGLIHTFVYLVLNIVFLAILRIGIYGYLLAINLSNLVVVIFLILYFRLYKNFISPKSIDLKLAKGMIRYSLPMIPNYISWWFNTCSDRYMVSFFCGASVTGIYSVANKIPTILNSMTAIFSNAWKISSVDSFGSEESIHFYNHTYRLYSGFLIIGASGLIIATKFLATLLFANDFIIAWRITPILIVAYTISALAQFVESIFSASKQTRTLFYASFIGAFVNIILNFILIPKYAGTGAAIATVIGYTTIWGIDMLNARKLLKINFNLQRLIPAYVFLLIEIVAVLYGGIQGYAMAGGCILIICVLNGREFRCFFEMILKKIKCV
ncbi:polysaccharide biosynthesis C-terminal domain-containing protein [Enterocloster bolteae]|uniref:oligosaccharide flippase family protein n=1 Tax=Enterocloster bolteae TaxID=208479 RepID=UPI00189FFCBB